MSEIKVWSEGEVYSNDMSLSNDNVILEIHFCTSYTEVIVQKKSIDGDGTIIYPTHTIIIPPEGSRPHWVDLVAVKDCKKGKWIA